MRLNSVTSNTWGLYGFLERPQREVLNGGPLKLLRNTEVERALSARRFFVVGLPLDGSQ